MKPIHFPVKILSAKSLVRDVARNLNLLIADTSRIGIELENDIARLKKSHCIKTVFDVGGNYGQSAIRFAKAFPRAQIYSFEPVSRNFQILTRNTRHFSRITAVQKGLDKYSGQASIGLSSNPGGHSLSLAASAIESEIIRLTTVDEYCHRINLDMINLLKIDVEGHEISVLEGAKKTLESNRLEFIYAECIFERDDSSPHTLFDDLREYLKGYGFYFFACYHEAFTLKSACAMANVLFVNKSMLPDAAYGRVKNIV